MKKKGFALMILTVLLCCTIPAYAAGEITVYYTNDIHTYIDNAAGEENALTYSKVAALKERVPGAILVDAGDHAQGTAYGEMDHGESIIGLMNAAGYDAATLGNHEFDYGMDGCMAILEWAQYPYVSCNFLHAEGEQVLDSYVMLEREGKQVAFVGITTPETLTSTTPAYFQDNTGNYVYDISGGEDGGALYAAVQTAIDAAYAAGADYVIALGHLGVDGSSSPWTSREVIANTTGLDAFIDGHSHTTIAGELVADRAGEDVVLTQTGSYLAAVGELTIARDGAVSTRLLTAGDLEGVAPDTEVKRMEDAWMTEVNEQLGEVIGYASVTLDNYDENGNRLVRKQNTNSGDFSADALYALFESMDMDVDAAVMNGGGIRNGAVTGELSYLTCKEIHPFGNVACLITVTGQQMLDMLEWSVSKLAPDGSYEDGSFLHCAGMRYTVDLTIPSTVRQDERGVWTGGPTGAYRVTCVEIWDRESARYIPLDRTASYNLAGYNYTLRDLGGGFGMLKDAVNVLDYVAEDYMVLAKYIQSFPVGEETGLPTVAVGSGYDDVNGQGRITIVTKESEAPQQTETAGTPNGYYIVQAEDCLWSIAELLYGSGIRWDMIYEANRAIIADPDLIFVGQKLILP